MVAKGKGEEGGGEGEARDAADFCLYALLEVRVGVVTRGALGVRGRLLRRGDVGVSAGTSGSTRSGSRFGCGQRSTLHAACKVERKAPVLTD